MPRLLVTDRAILGYRATRRSTKTSLAAAYGVTRRTLYKWRQRTIKGQPLTDLPRPGRPRSTSPATDRRIVSLAKSSEEPSLRTITAQVQTTKGTRPGAMTVRSRLLDVGLKYGTRPKKPMLTDKQKKDRLVWARANLNRDWTRVLFSDECTVRLFEKKSKAWGRPGKREPVRTVKHPAKINLHGCFGHGGYGRIFSFKENLDSPLMTRIVEEEMVPSAAKAIKGAKKGWVLLHDRDPKFRSHICTDKVSELGIEDIQLPAQSPGLNPMENMWGLLKDKIREHHPSTATGLVRVVKTAWSEMDPGHPAEMAKSMKKRCQAVIKAKGDYTKY